MILKILKFIPVLPFFVFFAPFVLGFFYFAWAIDKSFALLIHGTQPAGTEASKAMQKLRTQGVNGYSRKNKLKKV